METSEVRRRLRETLDAARRRAADRRARNTEASASWDAKLPELVVPLVHQLAQALRAENHAFQVLTPGGSVRLASERSPSDYVELSLDTTGERPAIVAIISRSRGRSVTVEDQHVRDAVALDELSEREILDVLLNALAPFLER